MNEASLPSPDTGANGYHLRRVAVKAMQSLDMVAPSYPNGAHPGAAKLAAFFDACRLASLAIGKKLPTLSVTPATISGAPGATQQLTPTSNSSGAITYRSGNPAVATVNATGLVTLVRAGTTRIHVTVAEDGTYKTREVTVGANTAAS